MIGSFLRYISIEKRYSQHTTVAYQNDLFQFEQFLNETGTDAKVPSATFQEIRSWIISLMEAGLSARSANRKIATLRSFYKFLKRNGHRPDDPTSKIKSLKTPRNLPNFFQEAELNNLLDQLEFNNDFEGQRDKLVLEMLYGTGMRLSELINLFETDINTFDGTIKVLGKGNKERIIPISPGLITQIKSYLELKKNTGFCKEIPYLFVTKKGEKAYPVMIQKITSKYLQLLQSSEKNSPHILRHSYATHILNKGADLNAVKDLLGHASLAATQVYTHNSLEKLKKIFDQAHPKA
jgi:integrase/recombinase XerC